MDSRPCELIKLRDKSNVYEPLRSSRGIFSNYALAPEMLFYGFTNNNDDVIAFATSTVLQVWEAGSTVLFETKNSVYWLVPIDIRVVPHLFADA